jgi:AAHS family 4-hydroxybenzoate transporter-like MFS transporter
LQLTAALVGKPNSSRLGALFSGQLRFITPLLWVTFVLTQALVFFMASWLSSLITAAGHPLNLALRALALLHFGGLLGGLLVSWLSDRKQPEVSLICNYVAGVAAMLAFAYAIHSAQWLLVLSFIAGVTVIGSAFCLSALATTCYPAEMRATGLGTALGVGRAGSILSPLVGGVALAKGFSATTILATFSILMAICAVAIALVWLLRRTDATGTTEPAPGIETPG